MCHLCGSCVMSLQRGDHLPFIDQVEGGENCKFGTSNIALRNFAIPNVDFAKIGLETLSSCKPYH
jgi:hypothetical protein